MKIFAHFLHFQPDMHLHLASLFKIKTKTAVVLQVHLPRPGGQRFIENEDGGFIVTMEKLNVQNVDDLLIQLAQVDDIG